MAAVSYVLKLVFLYKKTERLFPLNTFVEKITLKKIKLESNIK